MAQENLHFEFEEGRDKGITRETLNNVSETESNDYSYGVKADSHWNDPLPDSSRSNKIKALLGIKKKK